MTKFILDMGNSLKKVTSEPAARALLDYLRSLSIDPNKLFDPKRIASIESSVPHVPIPFSEWAGMLDKAIQISEDPNLPLKVGTNLRVRHIGLIGFVLASSKNVEEAAYQLERYLRLIGEISISQLSYSGDRAILDWTWPANAQPPPWAEQMSLAARIEGTRWLTARQDLKWDADFQMTQPENTNIYTSTFGGKVRFNQKNTRLIMPAADLKLPAVMYSKSTKQFFDQQANAIEAELKGQAKTEKQVSTILAQQLATSRVSIDLVASELGMSARTLKRYLLNERTSFRKTLESVRKAKAIQYLKEEELSLGEISFMLGYTEQSTFQQAFKRWTQSTPAKCVFLPTMNTDFRSS